MSPHPSEQTFDSLDELELAERMRAVIAALNVALAASLGQKAATDRRRSA